VSIVALYFTKVKSAQANLLSRVVLVLSLFCLVVVSRAAYLGGQIRHTEISGASANQTGVETEDDD
jgi:Na+-transporting NADH:ubiquinone oxidoreductase subunit NqrC